MLEYKVYNTYFPVWLQGLLIDESKFSFREARQLAVFKGSFVYYFLLYTGEWCEKPYYCIFDFRARKMISSGKTIKIAIEDLEHKWNILMLFYSNDLYQTRCREAFYFIQDMHKTSHKVDFFCAGIHKFDEYYSRYKKEIENGSNSN